MWSFLISDHMRLIECGCDPPGKREVVTGVDWRDGSPTGYYEECPSCGGIGEQEIESYLIEEEDCFGESWGDD